MDTMDCIQARNLLSEYQDGTLDAAVATALNAHLRGCGECDSCAGSLLAVRQFLRGMPPDPAPPEMISRVLAAVETEGQLNDVRGELEDRYGPPPPAVKHLLEYAELKLLAQRVGVAGIERKRDLVSVRFTPNAQVDPSRLAQFVASQRGAAFTPAGILKFSLKASAADEVLSRLKALLLQLAGETVAAD